MVKSAVPAAPVTSYPRASWLGFRRTSLWVAAILACAVTSGCGKKNKDATPAQTQILDWDLSKTSREAMKTASLADKKATDVEQVLDAGDEKVKLKLHLDTAVATYQEAGQTMTVPTVAALKAVVVDGKDFTFTPGLCRGPNYPLEAPGATPKTTIVDCTIHAKKPSYDVIVYFQVFGDGTVSTK